MVFSSAAFLFAFLPLTLLFYWPELFRKNREKEIAKKNAVLLAASLIFYAWGEPVYILLMLFSIVYNYFAARSISYYRENEKKAGKNRKKPVYDSFRKFFDYDKYLKQEGGAAPRGQNALSRLSRHMKETSENGTEL